MKFNVWHWVALLGTPCATAFLDYLVNSASPFSAPVLEHAGLATALVGLAVLKHAAGDPGDK